MKLRQLMQVTAIASVIGVGGPAIAHGTNYERSADAGATTTDATTLNGRTTSDDATLNRGFDSSTRSDSRTDNSTLHGGMTDRGNNGVSSDSDSNNNAGDDDSSINGAPPGGNSYGSSSTIVNDGTPSGRQTSRGEFGPLPDSNRSLDQPMSDSDRSTSTMNGSSQRPMSDSDLTTSPAAPNAR